MRSYTTISFLVALGLIAGSIFFFLEEDDQSAHLFLLLAVMVFIGLYYILKGLYYIKEDATLNEFSFIILLPIAPVVQLLFKEFINVDVSSIASIRYINHSDNIILSIDYLDLVLLPYYIITVYFILRTYLRYPFIRLTGHSSSGIPAKLIAIFLSLALPALYLIVGIVILSNFFLVLFGFIILLVGILGLFV